MLKTRMLILDDDADVGKTLQGIAESLDLEAAFVTSPHDFLEQLVQMVPDVIVIDLVMPELDGVEILRLLAERQHPAKIILTSGLGAKVLHAAHRSAAEHGLNIAGVLPKPISREALLLIIGRKQEYGRATLKSKLLSLPKKPFGREDLECALQRREFEVWYQPKIGCVTDALAGFEALVRWIHPTRGLVMPDEFIPLAEQVGLIDALTEQILEESLFWFQQNFRPSNLTLSINISAKSLVGFEMANTLTALCRQFTMDPKRVVLEVTESSAMVDPLASLDLLTRFRLKGFQVSIDDFGTGFSSMIQLVRLPFSEIKVDKSFVIQAGQSEESRSVIKSIIDLGHSLGLHVTAEGVEDKWTLDYISELGCDLAQGYFIGRPMAAEFALAWITHRA